MTLGRSELEALYRDYGPAVRARCRSICGSGSDADEALQETFLKAWRARHRFDGRHPLAWLQVIARNTAIEVVRKRRPWADDPETWIGQLAAPSDDPRARIDIARLLDELAADDAVLLRLRYAEGWRIHELADHYGTSQRTLRRRLERLEARARAILRVPEVC